jgi:hypothetical protein
MTSSLPVRGARTCLLGIALVAAHGAASPVSAAAFSADLTVDLAFGFAPGAGLGIVVFLPPFLPGCTTAIAGNAFAACANPTSVLGIGAGTLTFTAGPVLGATGFPFGFATAESHGVSHEVFVGNPGAVAVPFNVTMTFAGDLVAGAGPLEFASAFYGFSVTRNGVPQGPLTASASVVCNACGVVTVNDAPPAIVVMDVVPAGGLISYAIDPFVEGEALSGIPEPSTLLLCATGIVGLLRRFIGSS